MNNVIEFEIGCRRCEYLAQIDKGTYCCNIRVHLDDSPVIPIKDYQKTVDWDICSGEYYVRETNKKDKRLLFRVDFPELFK